MIVARNIKEHGVNNKTYSGEVDSSKVIIIFEDGCIPLTGGDIKVITGKMVIKNGMNYLYVRDYR